MKTVIISGLMAGSILLAGCDRKSDPSGRSLSPPKEQAATPVAVAPIVLPRPQEDRISPPPWGLSWPERDGEIRRMLEERCVAAEQACDSEQKKLNAGKSTTSEVLRFAKVLTDARLELAETGEQVIAALEKQLEMHRSLEAETEQKVRVGVLAPLETSQVRYGRLGAEIELLKAKRYFQLRR
jgi:hypothetical protein